MREIQLTQGKIALVDNADFEWLNRWDWHAKRDHNTWYACRMGVLMHRFLLDADEEIKVDHKDQNGLNNQRSNLRLATTQQNNHNRSKNRHSVSIYKGVTWHSRDKIWIARITFNSQVHHLGSFVNEIDAAIAYDTAAIIYFGSFARLNFPTRLIIHLQT